MTDDATYTFAGVAKILEISESKLRYWSQVGFVGPSVRRGGKQLFNFQDLVSVKAAKELADRGFRTAEVRKALDAVRASLPHIDRPLDRIRVSFDGQALVVVDEGGAYDVTGQRVFDFGLGDLARRISDAGQGGGVLLVTPVPAGDDDGGADDTPGSGEPARNAYDWFVEGTRLEGRTDIEGSEDQAARAYRRSLALDPGLAPAHTNLGNIAYRGGDRLRARVCFETALALDPDQPEARFNLANLILEEGDLELAVAELRRVLQVAPEFADAHFNLAVALERLGGRAQARAHLERYIKLEPEPAAPWAEQARALIERLSD
ncbi:MAG TPA: tetratricopeptide repeat protein [Polyangia bacterium]|jgi:Tfp pilus assembly protein PilF/DNA-binding transcriptional MerR regulator|nr:tetratricopeptide repeat protein [Polyangia bacterium]